MVEHHCFFDWDIDLIWLGLVLVGGKGAGLSPTHPPAGFVFCFVLFPSCFEFLRSCLIVLDVLVAEIFVLLGSRTHNLFVLEGVG